MYGILNHKSKFKAATMMLSKSLRLCVSGSPIFSSGAFMILNVEQFRILGILEFRISGSLSALLNTSFTESLVVPRSSYNCNRLVDKFIITSPARKL